MPKVNSEITASKVRLIDESGQMLGVFVRDKALEKAQNLGLDLVQMVADSNPPVCKMLDYGKLKYENKKRQRSNKKKQKTINVKEIKFKLNIASGDYDTKIRRVREFIEKGDKVKISLWFKGREIVHSKIGMELIEKAISELSDIAKPEFEPKLEGKQIITVLAPLQP